MKKNYTYSILILLFTSISLLNAQNRFKAGVAAGINLTQLDGDLQQGYDKFGFNLGLRGFVMVKPQFDISTELFFNQKGGTYTENTNFVGNKRLFSRFTFRYADILLMANFNINPNAAETHYKHTFHTGISVGRLLSSNTSILKSSRTQSQIEQDLTKGYKSSDIAFVVGWSWFFNKRMGLTLRHTVSLNKMYENPETLSAVTLGDKGYQSLRSYFLSAQIFYNFISPKKLGVSKSKKKKKDIKVLEEL
jgi:hypothetical protein